MHRVMQKLGFVTLACWLMLLGMRVQAQTTWTPIHDTNTWLPSASAVAASAAPGSIGNGWTDVIGNTWSVNSSHQLVSGGGSSLTQKLLRPTSENVQDSRVMVTIASYVSGATDLRYCLLRGQANGDAYIAAMYSGTLYIWKFVSGATTALATTTYTATAGHTIALDFRAVGVSPTVLTAYVSDITTTTTVATATFSDSVAEFQTTGQFGITHYAVNTIDRIQTFSGSSAAATSYTFSGASTGTTGTASGSITLTPNGPLSGADSVSLSDGAGGSFASSPLSFANGATGGQSFMYTPSSVGTKTITATSTLLGASYTWSYTSTAASSALSVTNTNLFFSPYNTYSDGSGVMQGNNVRSGSTYALWNNPGAYLKISQVSGTSTGTCTLNVAGSINTGVTAANCPILQWSVDGLATQTHLMVASDTSVSLATGLTAGTHTIMVWFKSVALTNTSAMGDRWNTLTTNAAAIKITGVTIDGSSSLGSPTLRSKRGILYADSIGEGADCVGSANANTDQDATQTWIMEFASANDMEIGIVAFASQGYQQAGYGNVPVLPSSYAYYFSGASRLFTSGGAGSGTLLYPTPDFIIDGHGTNDRTGNQTTEQTLFQTQIGNYRTIGGANCKILMVIPPGGYTRTAKTAAVTAAADSKCYLLDAGSDFDGTLASGGIHTNDGLHPNVRGHAFYDTRLIKAENAVGVLNAVATYTAAANVRSGMDRGDGTLGTLVLPPANKVLSGTTYDATTAGTATVPTAAQVLSGVSFGIGGNGLTGTVSLPSAADVRAATPFGAASGLTGSLLLPPANKVLAGTTFDATTAGTLTLPLPSQVTYGVTFGVGGNGSTGTVTLPTVAQVLSGVQFGAGGIQYTGTATSGGSSSSTSLTIAVTRNGLNQPVLTWSADSAATGYKVLRSTNGTTYTVIYTTGLTAYTDPSRPVGNVWYSVISTH